MKTSLQILATLVIAFVLSVSGHAAISGINSPAGSNATIRFGDASSFLGLSNGGNQSPPVATPWNGSLYSTPFYTDGTTLDTAQGSIVASFTPASYAINIPIAFLNQGVGITGFAILQYLCVVEFQMDAAGFPVTPTLSPVFTINGTVQPAAGSYADLTGSITYTSAAFGLVDTVNYSYTTTSPGPFSATVSGVPVNGTTPVLIPNDTLTLIANFTFTVDPATINATTLPEPSVSVLAMLSALPLLLRRRRG